MIKPFYAADNSTIYDVCLNTYGTVNLLVKLMQDNGFPNVNTYPVAEQVFLYDDELVENQALMQTDIKYATVPTTSDTDVSS